MFVDHRFVETDNGRELILYLDPMLTEFSDKSWGDWAGGSVTRRSAKTLLSTSRRSFRGQISSVLK